MHGEYHIQLRRLLETRCQLRVLANPLIDRVFIAYIIHYAIHKILFQQITIRYHIHSIALPEVYIGYSCWH